MSYIVNRGAYGFCKSFIHAFVAAPVGGFTLSTDFSAVNGNGMLNLVMFG